MLRRKSLLDILSTGKGPRLAIAALLFWTTAIEPVIAQTSSPPAQQTPSSEAEQAAPHYSMEDLSYLLEPIALYPDPLLALILSASTFPVQIVEAERWTASNPISVQRGDFSEVDAMDWDSSVKALARFPDVIRKLADHLDWTESLGIAVATQTSDVTAAIQLLRAKAETLGNLQSTPEQTVTTRDEGGSRVIYVLPANPERIYVPSTIQGSCSVVPPLEPLPSALACWLAQPGTVAGGGTIADGIKSGSLRQHGIPRLPLGGRRIAQGAGHRDPGDRIARAAIDLNAPAAGRNVLADLVVVPKFRVFGRSVLVADQRARTFGRSVLAGPGSSRNSEHSAGASWQAHCASRSPKRSA
jgi:hypothetical protein